MSITASVTAAWREHLVDVRHEGGGRRPALGERGAGSAAPADGRDQVRKLRGSRLIDVEGLSLHARQSAVRASLRVLVAKSRDTPAEACCFACSSPHSGGCCPCTGFFKSRRHHGTKTLDQGATTCWRDEEGGCASTKVQDQDRVCPFVADAAKCCARLHGPAVTQRTSSSALTGFCQGLSRSWRLARTASVSGSRR